MKSLSIIIILFTSFVMHAQSQNRSINFENGLWSEAKAKAQQESKMIFVDAYTVWCGPCKWMDKNVFTNDTVADYYNANFVNLKIDMEKGEGIELAKQWEVTAYPSLLFFSSSGELLHRKCGSDKPSNFIELGKEALDPEKQFATLNKKYESVAFDEDFFATYILKRIDYCLPVSNECNKYFATQKDEQLSLERNWKLINNAITDIDSREFKYLESNIDKFVSLYGKPTVDGKISRVYTTKLANVIFGYDSINTFEMIKAKISSRKNPLAEKAVSRADMEYYERNKDWKKYAPAADKYISSYSMEDFSTLNNTAYTFYENITEKVLLEKAAGWAKKSIELKEGYFNQDTYGALLYKLGKKQEAKQAVNRAIELGKKDGQDTSPTEELLKKINQLK
jgi:thioredoxin-related protein